jgi:hypothetical protein
MKSSTAKAIGDFLCPGVAFNDWIVFGYSLPGHFYLGGRMSRNQKKTCFDCIYMNGEGTDYEGIFCRLNGADRADDDACRMFVSLEKNRWNIERLRERV